MSEYEHQFGGDWTEEKLDCLKKYLPAYLKILRKTDFYKLTYIDAFAGTGERSKTKKRPKDKKKREAEESQVKIVYELESELVVSVDGSAHIALKEKDAFDEYIFIEKDANKVKSLESLKDKFPDKAEKIRIRHGDANGQLRNICKNTDWRRNRAVVFLDPFGMQVEWETLEAIAKTKAIDLWMLVPIGMGALRMLTKNGPPDEAWQDRLTTFFGSADWLDEFYKIKPTAPLPTDNQLDLFADEKIEVEAELSEGALFRDADFESVSRYFIGRLDTIFYAVCPNYLVLRTQRNNSMFLLCFAAANEKGAKPAIKIADDLILGPVRMRTKKKE